MVGMFRRAAAISIAGVILSQLVISTSASNRWAIVTASTESAISSRVDERVVHPDVAHRDAVVDADRRELDRRAAGHSDAVLDGARDLVEVVVTRDDLVLRVADADQRAVELLARVAHRVEERSVGGAIGAALDFVTTHPTFCWHSGISLGLRYVPLVRPS